MASVSRPRVQPAASRTICLGLIRTGRQGHDKGKTCEGLVGYARRNSWCRCRRGEFGKN